MGRPGDGDGSFGDRDTVPLGEVQDVFGMCGPPSKMRQRVAFYKAEMLVVFEYLVTGTTTPTPEGPLGNAGPQVTHVSGKIDDLCARLRPPSETPLGNAGPQVTHVSGKIDDSCYKAQAAVGDATR